MKVFLGADHNGYELKKQIHAYLLEAGCEVVDKGDERLDKNDDFPTYAARVASEVLAHEDTFGILICGSGQGVCMAANRFKGIRAALAWNEDAAFEARDDDDSNVLCLPAQQLDARQAREIVGTFLKTPFSGAARYRRRNAQLDELV